MGFKNRTFRFHCRKVSVAGRVAGDWWLAGCVASGYFLCLVTRFSAGDWGLGIRGRRLSIEGTSLAEVRGRERHGSYCREGRKRRVGVVTAPEVWMLSLINEVLAMKSKRMLTIPIIAGVLAFVGGWAISAQDKYTVKVPNGLSFSEFRGYEAWQVVSISQDGDHIAAILANPVMIKAYMAGVPGNGKPFPDGAKMAKIHWNPKKMETFPAATVPGTQHDVDFMVKDSKRFADSGGWGYAVFDYDAASDTFTPGTLADKPPQGNDAKCGFACHTSVKTRDYVFTDYGHR